jgi:hypothetical protein
MTLAMRGRRSLNGIGVMLLAGTCLVVVYVFFTQTTEYVQASQHPRHRPDESHQPATARP